jgi:exosortase A-associated hydrolase 1
MMLGATSTTGTTPIRFRCEGELLQGMLHLPEQRAQTGVLVIVGGPQYRVGSHRQFVLLARDLRERGVAVMRFDYRGLGDSSGAPRTFEDIGPDVRAAVDEFFRLVPGLRRVVLWGLCDAASAALFYAGGDTRVAGLVLLNPWARAEHTVARAYLRHYYLRRLFDWNAWRALLTGAKSPLRTLGSVSETVRGALGSGTAGAANGRAPLIERMRTGFEAFKGPALLIMSGDDITAAEFRSACEGSRAWRRLLAAARVTHRALDAADHTFSTRAWRDQVADWTADWIELQWPTGNGKPAGSARRFGV